MTRQYNQCDMVAYMVSSIYIMFVVIAFSPITSQKEKFDESSKNEQVSWILFSTTDAIIMVFSLVFFLRWCRENTGT